MPPGSPRDRFVDANGLRFHVVERDGEDPPLVFLHATGFHARVWDPVIERLDGGKRIVAFDARGHGDSDKPDTDYPWSRFVDDAVAIFDALRVEGALLVGHSFGATTAAWAVTRRPDLARRLVLVDPILVPHASSPSPEGPHRLVEGARRRRADWPDRATMIESYRDKAAFAGWTDEALRLYVEHGAEPIEGGMRLKCPPEIEARVFEGGRLSRGWDALSRIGQPVLLVRGETSPAFAEADAGRALDLLPDGRIETIPGTSHFVPMERPEAVARAIAAFAAEEESGR